MRVPPSVTTAQWDVPAWLTAPVLSVDIPHSGFGFGSGAPVAGVSPVAPDATFSQERGFGFEPGAAVTANADGIASTQPYYFSATVPAEGNYRVTITFPGGTDATVPSMSFSSACCTPSPDTSRVIEGLSDLREILSISSM